MGKPFYVMEKHGITQSLLANYLTCREKARLYLDGWGSKYHSEALMYGSLCHGILEYAYTDIMKGKLKGTPSEKETRAYASRVETQWNEENPKADTKTRLQLDISLAILEKIIPLYFDFWAKDFTKIKWEALEEEFAQEVPEAIKNTGYKIFIRGKQDGRFSLHKDLWLFETKTKSMVNEGDLTDTLAMDLQVNVYLWVLWQRFGKFPSGVLYNILRKTSLRITKDESVPAFAKRVAQDVKDRPEFYFIRLEVAIAKEDMLKFEKEFVELLSEFARWRAGDIAHYKNPNSCVGKYGRCEYIGACANGNFDSLVKRTSIFKELSDL